jgi:membrane protease PFF1-like protein/peptidase M28-like protein
MAAKSRNPIGFTPLPVATIIVLVYGAILSILITFHNVIPKAPSNLRITGINLTEAWHDLQILTNGYHPYNSHRNDEVRTWLLSRIKAILHKNDALGGKAKDAPAVLFDDSSSNLTFASWDSPLNVAFTGTNIIVYIRGTEDEAGPFWEKQSTTEDIQRQPKKGGVLVNAHFDSVPSGFGATDDGVGVVTVLQLIQYFTHPDHRPKRGIVALLNNSEEDYLNGAIAFSQHPISSFPHTFLNLEGAGAGGRAVLFRSTDTEVTRFYKRSPHPFGSVISADGFKRGLIRSATDYTIFNGFLGMRGLDVAFMEPRARYHTNEDSVRYTSERSLWHMLSGALATMEGLSSDSSSQFDGKATGPGKVESGSGTTGVWFDLFGRAFAVFELHTLFAISVTLVVVTPLVLIALTLLLIRFDKWYPLSSRKILDDPEEEVRINGWKAVFRTPIAFVVSAGALIGLVFLLVKVNPYIIYSSEYSVWSMMLSLSFCLTWFILRGAAAMRPSALQKMYALIWMYIGAWILLVGYTVLENNYGLGGGYFIVFYFAAIFTALLISYLELFALPSKTTYAELVAGYDSSSVAAQPSRSGSQRRASSSGRREDNAGDEEDEANERTSLLRGDRQTTFASGYGAHNRSNASIEGDDTELFEVLPRPYKHEQAWSGKLPSWTWLLQFFILGPFMIILLGQIGLFQTAALRQTPADGNSVLVIYFMIAALTTFLLAPVTPFVHRLTYVLPSVIFLVFIGTLLYNLLAFPFSETSRLKVYFVQNISLETGHNQVSLTGLPDYVESIIDAIPSSAGQKYDCGKPDFTARYGLRKCAWAGPPPNVLLDSKNKYPPPTWMNFSATRNAANKTQARFHLSGRNTRACRLLFDKSISNYSIKGYATDSRFPTVNKNGCTSIRLWSREWGGSWEVDVEWDSGELSGRAVCLWSDANDPAAIPAYEEVLRFMPRWSIATKLSDGLVEGWKGFNV